MDASLIPDTFMVWWQLLEVVAIYKAETYQL